MIDLNDVKPAGSDMAPAPALETPAVAVILIPPALEAPEEIGQDTYRHHKGCGGRTTIPPGVNPQSMFDGETAYCVACNQRLPVSDFSWARTGARLVALVAFLLISTVASAGSLYDAARASGDAAPANAVQQTSVESIADSAASDLSWVIAFHAGDLLSTSFALERCNGNCTELNPAGPTPEARIALKMATAAATGLAMWKFRRAGHGRAATIMRWVIVGVNSALIINNTSHAIRRR